MELCGGYSCIGYRLLCCCCCMLYNLCVQYRLYVVQKTEGKTLSSLYCLLQQSFFFVVECYLFTCQHQLKGVVLCVESEGGCVVCRE